MKVLNPAISVIMPSHMKPEYLPDALDSLLEQTRLDLHVIVVDSGEWINKQDERSLAMQATYLTYSAQPLVEWHTLGELPGLIARKCPYAYIINEVLGHGLARGRYISFATDDDIFKPTYMEQMAGFLDNNPDAPAVYCAQDRITLHEDGTQSERGGLPADEPRTKFDQYVDLLQVMVRASVMGAIRESTGEWLPEEPDDSVCRHADGIFLDKIGELASVPNIAEALVIHRFTPLSTYN